MKRVCVAGATGWAGSALSKGIFDHPEMELVAAVSRKNKGGNLAEILKLSGGHIPVFGSVNESLELNYDVLVEYTKPDVAKNNILLALERGINVVVGTSGLQTSDYDEISEKALLKKASVLAVGNFSMTANLMQKFAETAAKFINSYEIVEYAYEHKVDAPSGTALELASRLSKIQHSKVLVPTDDIVGHPESRGARIEDVQIHSVRLPGFVITIESIFGLPDEKLTIKHEAGSGAQPYVKGALLAIEKVHTFKGLKRGLDSVMDFN